MIEYGQLRQSGVTRPFCRTEEGQIVADSQPALAQGEILVSGRLFLLPTSLHKASKVHAITS
jgi:hypothetical protein